MEIPEPSWYRDALKEYITQDSPVTYTVIGLIFGIFTAEVYFMYTKDLTSPQLFATGLFDIAPFIAWPLAPILHKGVFHLVGSIFGIFFLGIPVEKDLGKRMYTAFLVASGYLSTAIGAGVMLLFADGGIAFYGSSGIVFALAGYAVVALPRGVRALERFETVAVFIGAISVGFVVLDPVTGPYLTVDWVNGGHLGGLIVGIVVGWASNHMGKSNP